MTREASQTSQDLSWLAGVEPGRWKVLSESSDVTFSARHFLVAKVRGRFRSFSAELEIGGEPGQASVTGSVDAGSVDTGDEARDEHLRSSDFLSVERWLTLSLVGQLLPTSTTVRQAKCQMTIRDQTHPVDFEVHVHTPGVAHDGSTLLRLSADAKVNRKDFDLRWNATIETGGVVVADEVDLHLELEAHRISA